MTLAAKKKKIFDNRYEIVSIVGRGAASVVYHARHLGGTQADVALKVLLGQKGDRTKAELLRKEALAMVSARHKYVIRLDDFHSVGELSYLSMEYAPESDLRKYMRKTNNRLGPVQTQLFLIQIAEALNFVHQAGMIHRDIKPDNILVVSDYEARLADFGVAVLPGETSSLTELQKGVGTMSYMAPEVLEGIGYDQCSDIYALGVTFYEVLTGVHPFQNVPLLQQLEIRKAGAFPSVESLAPNTPPQLAKVIMQALRYDPQERFASGRDLVQTLLVQKGGAPAAKEAKPVVEPPAPAPVQRPVGAQLPEPPAPTQVEQAPAARQEPPRADKTAATPTPRREKMEEVQTAPQRPPRVQPPQPSKKSPPPPKSSADGKQRGLHRIERKIEKVQSREADEEAPQSAVSSEDVDRLDVEKTVAVPVPDAKPKLRRSDAAERLQRPKPSYIAPPAAPVDLDDQRKRFFMTAAILVFFLILAVVVRPELAKYAIKRIKTTLHISTSQPVAGVFPQYDGSTLAFPNLPGGVYSGSISGFAGQERLALNVVSLPEKGYLVFSIGIEGWSPALAQPFTGENQDQEVLRIKANGAILDMTGQSENGELKGNFRDVVSGEQGEWELAPVNIQSTEKKG